MKTDNIFWPLSPLQGIVSESGAGFKVGEVARMPYAWPSKGRFLPILTHDEVTFIDLEAKFEPDRMRTIIEGNTDD